MQHTIRFWGPVGAWAAVIFLLSSLPGDSLPPTPSFWRWFPADKLVHAGLFAVLSLLIMHALRRGHGWAVVAAVVVAVGSAAAYGAVDEWRQSLIPLRSPSGADWVADAVGAMFGAWAYLRYESRAGQKTHHSTS